MGNYVFPYSPTENAGTIPASEQVSTSFVQISGTAEVAIMNIPLPKNVDENSISLSAWTSGLYTFKYYFWIYLKEAKNYATTSLLKFYLCKNQCTTSTFNSGTSDDFNLIDSTSLYARNTYIQEYINVQYNTSNNQVKVWIGTQTGFLMSVIPPSSQDILTIALKFITSGAPVSPAPAPPQNTHDFYLASLKVTMSPGKVNFILMLLFKFLVILLQYHAILIPIVHQGTIVG